MPELPEVETVVRELRPRLVGRRIASVAVSRQPLRRRWSTAWEQSLVGRRVQAVRRRGKWILIDLDDGQRLVIHLGMTGRLTVVARRAQVAAHTHLTIALDRGRDELRFEDIRRFGSATLFPEEAAVDRFLEGLGPEPFDLDLAYWHGCLAGTDRCLKAVLLDQRVVAGIGNIYADEGLFLAGLHPTQPGRTTSPDQARRLRRALVTVLNLAIHHRGSSIRNYVGGSGLKGQYQDRFRVYGRAGQPCRRCRNPIERIRLAGRSTHFCPRCQGSGVRGQESGVRNQSKQRPASTGPSDP